MLCMYILSNWHLSPPFKLWETFTTYKISDERNPDMESLFHLYLKILVYFSSLMLVTSSIKPIVSRYFFWTWWQNLVRCVIIFIGLKSIILCERNLFILFKYYGWKCILGTRQEEICILSISLYLSMTQLMTVILMKCGYHSSARTNQDPISSSSQAFPTTHLLYCV